MVLFLHRPTPVRFLNISKSSNRLCNYVVPSISRYSSSTASPSSSFSSTDNINGVRPIRKLLIANRGEIACRIMKTCERMGVTTVAVFSDADRNSLHVRRADESYHIGAAASQESYLRKERILDVAKRSGADAVHPGYGFLSENAEFAELCDRQGVIFVGPPPNAIRDMGLKNKAKSMMAAADVPVVFGYHGSDQSDGKLKSESQRIGYPVMLKAVRGGGGKGMRIVLRESEFDSQLESARREAMKSFGNDEMIVEKFVVNPRHVEVQVFGDRHDNYVYLFERDCSVQRRHQKIIEEAPAPGLDEQTRRQLGESAVKAARAVKYVGAGTVEFIMDPSKKFYFMEMNTRLQVEHPISEMITGFDFVEWQLRVAAGEQLPVKEQSKITKRGHAFEARIYAEDTEKGAFMPAPGLLNHLDVERLIDQPNTRVETGVQESDRVSVHYDPMIAKLVVWDTDRESSLKKLDDSLSKFHIAGVKTNVNFLRRLARHEEFRKGNVYTDFIRDYGKDLFAEPIGEQAPSSPEKLASFVGGLLLLEKSSTSSQESESSSSKSMDPFDVRDQFRMNLTSTRRIRFATGSGDEGGAVSTEKPKEAYAADLILEDATNGLFTLKPPTATETSSSPIRVFDPKYASSSTSESVEFNVEFQDRIFKSKLVELKSPSSTEDVQTERQFKLFTVDGSYDYRIPNPKWVVEMRKGAAGAGDGSNPIAPMPGVIEKVLVQAGQEVNEGDPLVIMVAMKMEYTIRASRRGRVEKIMCKVGDNVPKGARVISFEEEKKEKKEKGE